MKRVIHELALFLALFLCSQMWGQNPRQVLTGHPRLLLNDTVADTWSPSQSRLAAVTKRVMPGGNPTAITDFTNMLAGIPTTGKPDFVESPDANLSLSLDYFAAYALYHKAGNDAAANRYAAAAWAGMIPAAGSNVVTIISIVTDGSTATVTFAAPPSPALTTGTDHLGIWGVGNDALCGNINIASVPDATHVTFASSVAPGTYSGSGMIGAVRNSAYWAWIEGVDENGDGGTYLSMWAYFYDWCYDWLVANGHDQYARDQIKAGYWSVTLTRGSTQFNAEVRESDFHNHAAWDICAIPEAGIALFGDDPLGATILNEGAGYLWEGVQVNPAGIVSPPETYEYNLKKSVDALTGGAMNWEGPGYWREAAPNYLRAIEAYDTGTGRSANLWSTQFSTAKNAGLYKIYALNPAGFFADFADSGNGEGWVGRDNFGMVIVNDRFPDPHFVYLMTGIGGPYSDWNSGGNGETGLVLKLIFFPYVNGPGSHNFSDLPLSGQFGPDIVMRSGWGASDSYYTYTSSLRGVYHRHDDGGNFTVFKNNFLIIGQPYSALGPAYHSYHRRTIGGSTLTIYDPNDCWKDTSTCGVDSEGKPQSNDGGQLYTLRRFKDQFDTSEFQLSRIWSGSLYTDSSGRSVYNKVDPVSQPIFTAGSGYEYIQHDMTSLYVNAYTGAGDNPTTKVSSGNGVVRKVVHFQPTLGTLDPLVIFDQVTSTNASFKKSWLLHTVNAPAVNGSASSPGDTTYPAATVTKADNGTGRVYVNYLLPANPNVRTVGGNACTPIPIQSCTNANPTVCYAPGHGLQAGETFGADTGTTQYGSIWSPGWNLDNGYGNFLAVGTVPDPDHFTVAMWNGGSDAYDVPLNSTSYPLWATAFSSGAKAPSGSGVYAGQVYYQTGAKNPVWQWDGSSWRNLYSVFSASGYPAGLGITGPTVYTHANCNWAFYVDQFGPAGSGGAHLWNSSADGTALQANSRANWLIAESPASSELTDYFLNVVTATTTSVNSPPAVSLNSSGRSHEVQIADSKGTYVAVFSNQSGAVIGHHYGAPHAGKALHVVMDLKAGRYTVKQNGQAISGVYHTNRSGAISFRETGGGTFDVSLESEDPVGSTHELPGSQTNRTPQGTAAVGQSVGEIQ
jgi:hypothetical protein